MYEINHPINLAQLILEFDIPDLNDCFLDLVSNNCFFREQSGTLKSNYINTFILVQVFITIFGLGKDFFLTYYYFNIFF
jgi:hypothetical protein